jgi:pyruvate dehydrogenase E2 component (dihydrolipoamide acetyltransferase)
MNAMTKEIRLPEISENVDSGEVIEVLVSEGDTIDKDQSIVELETEKAAFEVPSPLGGKVTEIAVKKGDTIRVGQVILKIETQEREDREKEESTQEKKPSETTAPRKPGEAMRAEEAAPAHEPLPASPAVRRKARKLGVDLRELEGTGPGGRILAEDVEKRAKQIITSSQCTPAGARTGAPLPDFSRWGETEAKPMSSVRRVTAENVFLAWVSVPHVT